MRKEQKETNQRLENNTNNIEVQVKENTEILRVLQHNSQVHKFEIDKLNMTVAKEVGEIKKEIKDLNSKIVSLEGTNVSIMEMYGEHEVEIKTIRRKHI